MKLEFFERQALDFGDERPLLCFAYQFGAVTKALRQLGSGSSRLS